MTNFMCLSAWKHDVAPTSTGHAYTEGEQRKSRNLLHPLTLHKMMVDFKMPGISVPKRVKLSRAAVLILSLCAILASFESHNTDTPAQRHSSVAVRRGDTTTAGRIFHRQRSVFLGVEAADANSGKEQRSHASANVKADNGWQSRRAAYGGQHASHAADDPHRSVPSHLIMRAAVEEALSTLEDRSHGVAESASVEHSPSTRTPEAEKKFLSYENVTHEPTEEGGSHAGVYSEGGLAGDDTVEGDPHDSHEEWTEEHVGKHEDVEHTDVRGTDPAHRMRRRHRVYGGGRKSKTPPEVFNQYDSLLTVIDGPDSPDKGVSVGSDVLEAVAEPMIPSPETDLGVDRIVALKRGVSRVLGLQPIAVVLTAMLIAVALMLAQSQSDAGKDFLQQTLLPGRQESRGFVSHPLVMNDGAENRYFERGYIADPGEDGAGQQVAWVQRDDETTAGPYDNDFRTRGIERRVIRLESGKDQRLKNNAMSSLPTPAYRAAEQADSSEGVREPFAVPAGAAAAETMYKHKSEYPNFADSNSHEGLETVGPEDDESGAHHG